MTIKSPGVIATMMCATGIWVAAGTVHAAEITVMATQAVKAFYVELVPTFEHSPLIDELIKLGKLVPGSRVDLAKSGVGVAVRAGLLPIAGITYIGPLPPEIQIKTAYSGGIHAGAKAPDAAAELLKHLKSPAAFSAIKKAGMEPSDTP